MSLADNIIDAWVRQLRGSEGLREVLNRYRGRVDFTLSVTLMANGGRAVVRGPGPALSLQGAGSALV